MKLRIDDTKQGMSNGAFKMTTTKQTEIITKAELVWIVTSCIIIGWFIGVLTMTLAIYGGLR